MHQKTNFIKGIIGFLLIIIGVAGTSSCQKETVVETIIKKDSIIIRKDSIIIRRDSIIVKEDVAKLLAKKWRLLGHEIEYYTGNTMTSKKNETWVGSNFYTDIKAAGTYQNFDLGGTTNGNYQLLSANYYVQDKGTATERYYYIISISDGTLITRGPFNKDNGLVSNFLANMYYQKW